MKQHATILIGLALLVAGCVSTTSVDQAVHRELEQVGQRDPTISANASAAARDVLETAGPTNAAPLLLDRVSALQLAARFSRDLQDKRDRLYGQALTLFAARRDFEIVYSGTADFVFTRPEAGDTTRGASVQVGASRVLPTGATVKFTGLGTQADAGASNGVRYASSAGVQVDQPLLAGAGYEASHGPLIQAERDYVYALREFSLQRQDFAIGVVRDFFSLVQQKSAVSNQLLSLQQFTYLRQRSEALFSVRRAPAIDVLRAQQQELSATNQLTTASEAYQIQKSGFLIQLGLPIGQPAEVAEEIPPLRSVLEDPQRAVALALARRPDVQTVQDTVVDAERDLRVARNAYLPQVDLFGRGEVAGDGSALDQQDYGQTAAAGLTVELPFDRRGRRDEVKRAAIRLDAARRQWQQKQDEIALEVADSYSQLRSLAKSVEIEAKNKEIAEKRAENANFLFKTGTLSNRDVVEAQNDLLNARNAHVKALLAYEVQRLNLLRNVGLLDVAPDGTLIELRP